MLWYEELSRNFFSLYCRCVMGTSPVRASLRSSPRCVERWISKNFRIQAGTFFTTCCKHTQGGRVLKPFVPSWTTQWTRPLLTYYVELFSSSVSLRDILTAGSWSTFSGMSVWGSRRVAELAVSSVFILSSLLRVLTVRPNYIVVYEISLGLRRLINKYPLTASLGFVFLIVAFTLC